MRNVSSGPARLAFVLLPVLLSLLLAALLVLAVGREPLEVLEKIWQGAFRNTRSFAGVLNFWIPLTLASVGLFVTFRAGLWNIGIEGQILAGAIFASAGALTFNFPPELAPLQLLLQILLGVLGGMVWAGITGALKIWLGVNEIFGGMALNALAGVWGIYLISGPWYPEGGSAQQSRPFLENALYPALSRDWPVGLLAIVMTAVAMVLVPLIMARTRWGLQLKATGSNPRSALLLGVPTTRVAMSAFLVCGALAGIAGSYRVMFTYGSFRPLVAGGIGFLGLLVVLLSTMKPLWIPLIAFVFSAILAGSTRLRVSLQLDSSLAGVMQGTLVLVFILFQGLRQRLEMRRSDLAPDASQDSGSSPGGLNT